MARSEGITEYDVVLSEPAEDDINSAFHFILLRSPAIAPLWRDEIDSSIKSLRTYPHRNPEAQPEFAVKPGVRQQILLYGYFSYRILYVIKEPDGQHPGIVSIVRVWHTSRGPLIETECDSS